MSEHQLKIHKDELISLGCDADKVDELIERCTSFCNTTGRSLDSVLLIIIGLGYNGKHKDKDLKDFSTLGEVKTK